MGLKELFGSNAPQGGPANLPMDQFLDYKCSCGHQYFEQKVCIKVYPGGLFGPPQVLPLVKNFCSKCGKEPVIDPVKMRKEHDENKNQLKIV